MNKVTIGVAIVLLVLILAIAGCTSRSEPDAITAPAPTSSLSQTLPSAPVNLTANAVSQTTVNIQWLDNSNNEDGFRIYRGTSLVGTVAANVQTYQDTGLQQGTTYQYAVKAYNQAGESSASLCSVTTLASPSAPSNLTAGTVSQSEVELQWLDNSNNEDGFRIYRGNSLIGTVSANTNSFQDTGLQPANTYQYAVIAYNQVGESQACTNTIKTLNPPITIWLDRIGVYDNREPSIRGNGDVYVLVGVVDGNTSMKLKFPSGQDETYSLDKDETVNIRAIIYSTSEVGDSLTIAFQGYESDGGNFEQLAYEALGMALDAYIPGGSTLLELAGIDLSNLIGNLLGQAHDWLGSYELTCNHNNNWCIGQYIDIVLQDERGVDCLRLWFTIESLR